MITIDTDLDDHIQYIGAGGNYLIKLETCLENYLVEIACFDDEFEVSIEECEIFNSDFVIATTPSFQVIPDVIIFAPETTLTMNSYIQTPLCGYFLEFECDVAPPSGPNFDCKNPAGVSYLIDYITMDETVADDLTKQQLGFMPIFHFKADDYTLAGEYTITQTVSLFNYKYTPAQSSADPFTFKLLDPCTKVFGETNNAMIPNTADFSSVGPGPNILTTSVKFATDNLG